MDKLSILKVGTSQFEIADAEARETLLTKADIGGVYPKLVAGDIVETEIKDDVFTYQVTDHTGKANINSIKGNTLVWNQLVKNGNFSAISPWSINSNGTLAVANNEGSITLTSAPTNAYSPYLLQTIDSGFVMSHKYLFSFDVYLPHQSYMRVEFGGGGFGQNTDTQLSANTWHRVLIVRARENAPTGKTLVLYPPYETGVWSENDVWKIRNVNVFDLTSMGIEADEFTSLFSFPYYSYNQGSLLSFKGNGIKTVGFNQWDEEWELGSIDSTGQNTPSTTEIRSKNYIPVILGESYYIKQTGVQVFHYYDGDLNYLGNQYIGESRLLNIPSGTEYIRFRCANTYGTSYKNDICLNISDPSRNGEYEPYTSSTTNLPVSTYFPTGMKSAGNVYDELTESKAINRIGAVDLGTLGWTDRSSTATGLFSVTDNTILYAFKQSVKAVCGKYPYFGTVVSAAQAGGLNDKTIALYYNETGSNHIIYLKDTSFSDVASLKSALSGVYLYYELATPTEVDVDLDLSYNTYEGGTEQLLPVNTDVPVTSPISMNVEFDFGENLNARFNKVLNMIAPVESAQVSKAYSVGQYLIYDYALYKVTSAIASGGTITVGTNVTATTLASILESLQ